MIMKSYTTQLGYSAVETSCGVDIYEDGNFVCELYGKSLDNYCYNGKVNEDKLEDDIKDWLESQRILDEMHGMI